MKKTINIAIILLILPLVLLTNSCLESDKGNPIKPKTVGSWTFQQTWVTYDIKGLYVKSSDVIWVSGNGGCILKTSNGGVVWERVNVSVNSNFPSISFYGTGAWVFGCVSVKQGTGEDKTKVADVSNILRSVDDGFSWGQAIRVNKEGERDIWSSVSGTTFCFGEYKKINDNVICAVGGKNFGVEGSNFGIIMYSEDDGYQWEAKVTDGEAYNKFNGIDFATDNLGFAVGHNGMIFKTLDAGKNWDEQPLIEYEKTIDGTPTTITVEAKFNKIHFVNSTTGFIVGDGSTILKTNDIIADSAQAWVSVFDPADFPDEDFANLEFNNFHFVNDNTGWVVGNNGIILRTDNGGSSWTVVDSYTQVDLNNVHLLDANNAFVVGAGGTIMRYRQ